MFKILDKQNQISVTSRTAKEMYPRCNFLLVDTVHEDGTVHGVIYAISEEPETLIDLTRLEQKLRKEGRKVFVGGDYYPNCILGIL